VDIETGELVSDAEVAEILYTAFSSRPKREQVTGRHHQTPHVLIAPEPMREHHHRCALPTGDPHPVPASHIHTTHLRRRRMPGRSGTAEQNAIA
jgi:hypothetical protein